MTGIDRNTGKAIDNLTSTFQSVEVIFSTRLSSRVMRREFGGGVAELLGRAVTPRLFAAFQQLIGTAIDLWEPRLNVRKISLSGTIDELRTGQVGLSIEADYMPRGHLGDKTVERAVNFNANFGAGAVQVN